MTFSKTWIYTLVIVLVLVVFAMAGLIRPVRESLRSLFVPVVRMTSSVGSGIGRWLQVDEEARVANERAEELEARLAAHTIDYARLNALEEENRSLRAVANFLTESGYQSIGARVISRSITHQTAVVTIDRGSTDGVEIGHAV
ncbi:hypothetical protein GF380_05370, partial [Candidatus Uhrbacteria bacterium]|nr:hypothetical protein [Candidatus Uhrbacteria bacterium]MBD3284460.1 hypothetical protein [Candidatus Uhrbacteria bacterium]